jgi:membrane associated rhomboid family serine protease
MKPRDPGGVPPQREPIFNIPGVLMAFVVVLVAIHAIRTYILPVDFDQWLVSVAAFIPARYLHSMGEQSTLGYVIGPVSYSFLHGGWRISAQTRFSW